MQITKWIYIRVHNTVYTERPTYLSTYVCLYTTYLIEFIGTSSNEYEYSTRNVFYT